MHVSLAKEVDGVDRVLEFPTRGQLLALETLNEKH
jgi:hypothetical protein